MNRYPWLRGTLAVCAIVAGGSIYLFNGGESDSESSTRSAASLTSAELANAPDGQDGSSAAEPPVPENVTEEWLASVQEDLALRQWGVRPVDDNLPAGVTAAYWAPNVVHNLNTFFTPNGIEVRPHEVNTGEKGDSSTWAFGMRLAGMGAPGSLTAAESPVQVIDGQRVEFQRGLVTEWYVNDKKGLEQGFTVAGPPSGVEDTLVITLDISGDLSPRIVASDRVALGNGDGDPELYMRDLFVEDANGEPLQARFTTAQNKLAIAVDVANAVYPIVVDPVISAHQAVLTEGTEIANLGASVASAGDVNGDGYADIIVGAPGFSNVEAYEGLALLYLGSAQGIGTTPVWSLEGNQNFASIGVPVGSAGDVNGDGYSDVFVTASLIDTTVTDAGTVYVFHGSASGLSATPDWSKSNNIANQQFGFSAAMAGDVNNDGYSDLIVGAPEYSNGQTREGAAYLYMGSANGLGTNHAWQVESNQAEALYGNSVASAGDVNGDGYSDVVVGARLYDSGLIDEGAAFVYHGSAGGLSASHNWFAEGNQANAQFGTAVSSGGDIDSNDRDEVIVSAPFYDNGLTDQGAVFVYLGAAGSSGLQATPYGSFYGENAGDQFGSSVAAAGDTNGDGFADFIVGAKGYSNGDEDEGAAYLYTAFPTLINIIFKQAWRGEGNQFQAQYGSSVAAAGDIDGDGFGDIIVGARWYEIDEPQQGAAFIYHGSGDGLIGAQGGIRKGELAGDLFGFSVASAGDVNGDGYGDVIVGAPEHDGTLGYEGAAYLYYGDYRGRLVVGAVPWKVTGGQYNARFGHSVAHAGDMNGDGYSDVIIGAPYYDNGTGASQGAAFVFLGSASGLSLTPAVTYEGGQP